MKRNRLYYVIWMLCLLLLLCVGCSKENAGESVGGKVSENDTVFAADIKSPPSGEAEETETGKNTKTPTVKAMPDEGDLLKNATFYAKILRNRYGGNTNEHDYAPGEFLLWALPVELQEDGSVVELSSVIVPYIVSDEGNDENLSMLSGGWDGEAPYGEAILMLTTDAKGEIVDAVFWHDDTTAGERLVYNNGGHFVKVDEDIYYIKVPENAFPQNALFGEYRSQILPGQECVLMRYQPNGEVWEVATVLGHSEIAYFDSCFYVCGKGEDYREQIWEVEKDSGQQKLVAHAKMLDIDPQTGCYVAYQEWENERKLTVFEGDQEACVLTLPTAEDTHIANAFVRGEYLLYWDAKHVLLDGKSDWGSVYAYCIPSQTTKCLGQIPFPDDGDEDFYPEMDQLAVRDQHVFFNIGYYGYRGLYMEQVSVFEADLEKEGSITCMYSEAVDEENIDFGFFHENSLPEIVMTHHQDHEIYLDFEKYTLCWAKPVSGALPEPVAFLTREEFETGNADYQIVEVAEYVDGKAYCVIDHVTENPKESVGWRPAYTASRIDFCEIDVETQEYTLMESQVITVEYSDADNQYMPFLQGEYSADTSNYFLPEYELYNGETLHYGDILRYGSYTIDELINELFVLETPEVKVSYAFHDFDHDNQEEMILRLENTEPSLPRWTGIFSFDYDCPLILESAYIDGYHSNAILYDNGYLITSGSNGAASYATSVGCISEARYIQECFTLRELYGYSVAELMYDLVDPHSVEMPFDYDVDEQFFVRAYVGAGEVAYSVDKVSDNPTCKQGELDVLNGLKNAGAVEVSAEDMDILFDLSDYCGNEIILTQYETRMKKNP